MDRAYSVLTIKSIDAARRVIRGTATTPETDRSGDVIEPLGATFAAEIPLLLHHNKQIPVGVARLRRPTAAGIDFEAELPLIEEAGAVKDEVDRAWTSIVHKLIRGVSIGFRPVKDGIELLKGGGLRILRSEILELSLVTVPAHQSATLAIVKALDLAASGRKPLIPGVSGPRGNMKTGEFIQGLENKRAATAARMAAILEKAAEDGITLSAEDAKEHDDLSLEVKAIDADLIRWRDKEKMEAAAAVPVAGAGGAGGVKAFGRVSVKSNVEPGTAFVRAAIARLVCKGNVYEAAEYAKRWDDSTPEVSLFLKAAVAAGSTTDAAWAKPLTTPGNVIVDEFLQLLYPATILGKITGFSKVPFLVPVPLVTAGGTYGWVGEAKPKPVTRMQFGSTTLPIAKAAGIIVLTEELVRNSNPSAEAVVRREMVNGIAAFLDKQFIDPAVAEVPNVSPASITNGVTPVAATTSPLADLFTLLSKFTAAGLPVAGLNLIMGSTTALGLSFFRNVDGSQVFPGLTVNGGTIAGITAIISDAAGDDVIAVLAPYVLYADDGGVQVDVSREASLQMDSAPVDPALSMVSLWQNNLVGLRAERFINWKKGHAQAAQWIDGVAWGPVGAGASITPPATGRASKG